MSADDLAQRFPLIDDAGRERLRWLQEHPNAPRYTHPGVHRLTPEGLRRAGEYAAQLASGPPAWAPGRLPEWLFPFAADCLRRVPFYRRLGDLPARWEDVPFTSRADLSREPWSFVPDDQPLDELVVYNTSGATGHPLDILTHADTLALYLPLLRVALEAHAVRTEGSARRVALALVCFQRQTYTYAAVSPLLGQGGVIAPPPAAPEKAAENWGVWVTKSSTPPSFRESSAPEREQLQGGFIKVNLWPDQWRNPSDRAAFLDDCAPEVISGDPISLEELARLPLTCRPRALVSTAMTLSTGLERALRERFGCPVLDLYSLNESGPVAVRLGEAHLLLQPRLYVEIVDEAGQICPPGQLGEIALSGGFNPLLPLLRYCTGDQAALGHRGGRPVLVRLEGRPPVVFLGRGGGPVNSIDVSLALRDLALTRYALHQAADGRLELRVSGDVAEASLRAALQPLFGPDQRLSILPLDAASGKVVQYTREFPEYGVRR